MNKKRHQLKVHCEALRTTARQGDPWVFLCAAAYIEFLANMTMVGSTRYADFVSQYLSRINPDYRDFMYGSGKQDLPEQMYFILRNGLVHSFTLKPNKVNNGRVNSILMSHDDPHLSLHNKVDGCILNAFQLIDDLVAVTDLIFEDSKNDVELNMRIDNYCSENPPLAVIPL